MNRRIRIRRYGGVEGRGAERPPPIRLKTKKLLLSRRS